MKLKQRIKTILKTEYVSAVNKIRVLGHKRKRKIKSWLICIQYLFSGIGLSMKLYYHCLITHNLGKQLLYAFAIQMIPAYHFFAQMNNSRKNTEYAKGGIVPQGKPVIVGLENEVLKPEKSKQLYPGCKI